ncbi:MAG: hypothetical protein HYY06_17930 [Deltaproteobacteria bacterium]|nr:hypothetical protein [Deltaproteobacteria bacterium]
MCFAARPDLGYPFVVAVLLVAPDDWLAVERRDLDLPPGWSTESLIAV